MLKLAGLGVGLALAASVLFFFAPEEHRFYPRCLLYTFTGWQCPGCGGLRATHQLLHGHFAAAFRYNPLFVLMLPVLAGLLVGYVHREATGRTLAHPFRRPAWCWGLAAAVIVFGVGRNLSLFAF